MTLLVKNKCQVCSYQPLIYLICWQYYLNIDILKMNRSAEQLFCGPPSDGCFWQFNREKNNIPFLEKCWPPQKNLSTRRLFILFFKYQAMKILLNNLITTLCNLIVTRVTKEGALVFYNKWLDWGCLKI